MHEKMCSGCRATQPTVNFCKNKRMADGYHNHCKACTKGLKDKNRVRYRAYSKQWRKENREHVKKYNQRYKKENREKINAWVKSVPIEKRRLWGNKERKRQREKERSKTPDYKAKRNKYLSTRYKNNVQYKLSKLLRARIRALIKKEWQRSRTTDLLGCSLDFFKNYLESKFLPLMDWNNHGEFWHLDHVIPCASFDLQDPEQQKTCFHYTNHQPLYKTTQIIGDFIYIGNLNKNRNIHPVSSSIR